MKTIVALVLVVIVFAANCPAHTDLGEQAIDTSRVSVVYDLNLEWTQRLFDFCLSTCPTSALCLHEATNGINTWVDCSSYFSGLGVPLPAGSSVRYYPLQRELRLVADSYTEDLFMQLLRDGGSGVWPPLVAIEFDFIAFNKADVAKVTTQEGEMSLQSANRLRRQGKGCLIYAPRLTTVGGQEATAKSAMECCYPTIPDQNITNAPSSKTNAAVLGRNGLWPATFDTREVGVITTVLPEVSPNRVVVCLTVCLEIVMDPIIRSHRLEYVSPQGKKQVVNPEFADFRTGNLSTTIKVRRDAPALLGGGFTGPRDDEITYVLVTVHLQKSDGAAAVSPYSQVP